MLTLKLLFHKKATKAYREGATKANFRISLDYLLPERKLGFFVKIKEDENFNHRNTGSISRIKI